MKRIRKFLKTNILKLRYQFPRKLSTGNDIDNFYYSSITLTDEEITNEEFKKHLGGGAQSWESRGAFQLYFLQEMGLQKESKVLDVGCGPGRAGKYLIQFLDESNYFGVDYNANFIKAAYAMSENNKLTVKKPVFQVIQGFDLAHFDPIFDYAMVFSVLNHCNVAQREAFFRMISKPLNKKGKVYISHALWFNMSYTRKTNMKLTNQFGPDDFDITKYGWDERSIIFPIIELTRN